MPPPSSSASSPPPSSLSQTADTRMLTSSDGCQIYADAVGDPANPCLLFIHGFTISAAVFDNIFFDAKYASQYYLVRYDVRGHGRSGKPDSIEAYSSKSYADDFAAVLRAFHARRPVVIAWSLGGTVVADIAAHLPSDTLAGVVYLAGCPCIGPIMQAIGTPFILELLTALVETDDAGSTAEHMQAFFDSCFKDPRAVPWEVRTLWQGMSTYQRPCHRRFALTRQQDSTHLYQLGSLHGGGGLPVLSIIGTEDPQIDTNALETQSRALFPANLEFVRLDGAGHSLHYENKEEVMRRIGAFVRRVGLGKKNAFGNGTIYETEKPSAAQSSFLRIFNLASFLPLFIRKSWSWS